MKDVAREAGVALGTVSKVVNGQPVGAAYRERVEEAIRKLNYQVNSYAQGMKSGKTNTIAVLIPNIVHPFFANLVNCINNSLSKENYQMMLYCTDFNLDLEQEYIRMAQAKKVDGIIGLTYNPNLDISENIPFVSIDRVLSPKIPCVASDNFAGGQLAAETLADLGCRKVAFLRIGSSLNNEPNKRKAGFENGCLSRNLPYEMKLLDDGDSYDLFYDFLKEHLHEGHFDIDGIFCVTDTLAYQITLMLEKLDVKVPDDVQIIGYDGTKHFGDLDYTCSTIVQPVGDIAEMAVSLLVRDDLPVKPPLVCLPVTFAQGPTTKRLD